MAGFLLAETQGDAGPELREGAVLLALDVNQESVQAFPDKITPLPRPTAHGHRSDRRRLRNASVREPIKRS
jgi:hypothetical protein